MVLYHYTTQTGLLGILQRRELWATDIRFFNDSKELRLVFEEVTRRLPAAPLLPAGKEAEFYRVLSHSLNIQAALAGSASPWVISFSADGDKLSQWRAYASPVGYSLGFEVTLPTPLFDPPEVRLVKCEYSPKALEGAVDQAIQRAADAHDPEGSLSALSFSFGSDLTSLAPEFKHLGFAEEEEWRVVIREPFVGNRLAMRFRPGRSSVVPYYAIPFEHEGHPMFRLKEIVVGPTVRRDLAEVVLTDLLIHTGFHDGSERPEIRLAKVPYRDT